MSDSGDSDVQIVSESSAAQCRQPLCEALAHVARLAASLRLGIQTLAIERAVDERPVALQAGPLTCEQTSTIQAQWDACELLPEETVAAWGYIVVSGAAFRTLQGDRWLLVRHGAASAACLRLHVLT